MSYTFFWTFWYYFMNHGTLLDLYEPQSGALDEPHQANIRELLVKRALQGSSMV